MGKCCSKEKKNAVDDAETRATRVDVHPSQSGNQPQPITHSYNNVSNNTTTYPVRRSQIYPVPMMPYAPMFI